jgi:hypothetical protein
MAKSKSSSEAGKPQREIIEMTLMIVPRGQSVAHGTMLSDGQLRQFKHLLSDSDKIEIAQLMHEIAFLV